MSKKGFFKSYEYVYDKYYDCVICSENKVLSYATTNRADTGSLRARGIYARNAHQNIYVQRIPSLKK